MDILKKIAIIILNYNSYEMTLNCLNNLKNLEKKLNVIIIDNNSNDDSQKKFMNLEKDDNTFFLYNNENKGYAAGNNYGLKYISDNMKEIDVAFIMNPDIEIKKIEYIYELYKELISNEKLAAITPLTIYNGKFKMPNDCCWKFLNKTSVCLKGALIGKIIKNDLNYNNLNLENNIAYVNVIQGCFFGIKMDIIKRIDYLDERTFLYCEEQILGRKIEEIGMKSAVCINSFIYHNHIEKDKSMKNKKNHIFHLKCLVDSRKIIIKYYLKLNKFQFFIRLLFLDFDYCIKKLLINIGL